MTKGTNKVKYRSPIVTIMGHVDHGKTSLLDNIRSTNVQEKEAGGITQSIGASVVTTKEKKDITFIDTPGHLVFSGMRERGAKIADVVVLVVAADDGVKPQTKEVVKYILENRIPVILVISKVDLPSANIQSVLGQIQKEGILLESSGGNVPFIKVSSKTKEGIKELLEMIVLLAEVNEITGDESGSLEAVVVESAKSKGGVLVTVVVKNGTLSVGKIVVTNDEKAKIKGLFDSYGISVKEVLPGKPAQILGFKELPGVGVTIADVNSDFSEKKSHSENRPDVGEDELAIIVKASNAGSLEAVLASIPQGVVVISSSVGDVVESDIVLAKNGNADIYSFGAGVSGPVKKQAESDGVDIEVFEIIYEMLEKLKEKVEKSKTLMMGKAEILAEFPFNNKRVAGSKMVVGKIKKGNEVVLMRGEQEIGVARVVSLKKQRNDVIEVGQAEEFGAILSPQLDFAKGDMLVSLDKRDK